MLKRRALPPFIQKRYKRYYAVLEIPKALRQPYPGKQPGKSLARLLRSLQTDSLTVAERRAGAVVAAWRSEFARLRNEGDDAFFYRRRLQKAKTDAERQQVLSEIELAAEAAEAAKEKARAIEAPEEGGEQTGKAQIA